MLSDYVLKLSIYKAELESSPENFTSCEEKDKIKCPSSKLQFRNVLLGGLLGQQVTKSLPTNSLFSKPFTSVTLANLTGRDFLFLSKV